MKTVVTAVVLACVCLSAAAGSIYKWVDEQGQVQYGDRPPHSKTGEYLGQSQRRTTDSQSQQERNERLNDSLSRAYDNSMAEHSAAVASSAARAPSQAERTRLEQIQRDISYLGDSRFGNRRDRQRQIKALEQERELLQGHKYIVEHR